MGAQRKDEVPQLLVATYAYLGIFRRKQSPPAHASHISIVVSIRMEEEINDEVATLISMLRHTSNVLLTVLEKPASPDPHGLRRMVSG
jgi:hypothetical protein